MSDFLFGSVESGTPVETQRGAQQLADLFQGFAGRNRDNLNDPTSFLKHMGLDSAVMQMLQNPASQASALNQTLAPFEARQTEQAVSGVRNMFGTAGGRFSRGLADRESQVRGEMANQFANVRAQNVADIQRMQAALIPQLAALMLRSEQDPWQMMTQFMRPGGPVYQQGALGDLIGLGGTIAMMGAGGGA